MVSASSHTEYKAPYTRALIRMDLEGRVCYGHALLVTGFLYHAPSMENLLSDLSFPLIPLSTLLGD